MYGKVDVSVGLCVGYMSACLILLGWGLGIGGRDRFIWLDIT